MSVVIDMPRGIKISIRAVRTLDPGVYRLHWNTGGSSIASVGIMYDGTNWYAPTNWTSENNKNPLVASTDWSCVEIAEKLKCV